MDNFKKFLQSADLECVNSALENVSYVKEHCDITFEVNVAIDDVPYLDGSGIEIGHEIDHNCDTGHFEINNEEVDSQEDVQAYIIKQCKSKKK